MRRPRRSPPGIMMNASASSNIIALRSCMDPTTRISPTVVPEICAGGACARRPAASSEGRVGSRCAGGSGACGVACTGKGKGKGKGMHRRGRLPARHAGLPTAPAAVVCLPSTTICHLPLTSRGSSAAGITPMTWSGPSLLPTASATAPISPTLPPLQRRNSLSRY